MTQPPRKPPTAPTLFRAPGQQTKQQRNRAYNQTRVRVDPNYAKYNTREWRQLRGEHFALFPWCRFCKDLFGAEVPARVCNHIDPIRRDEDFFDRDNLEGLCRRCHDLVGSCEKSGKVPFAGRDDFRGKTIRPGHKFFDERAPIYRRSSGKDPYG